LNTPSAAPGQAAANAEQWRTALRHFHLAAEAIGPLAGAAAVQPALPPSLVGPEALLRGWPLVLPVVTVNGGPAEILPLGEVLRDAIAELGAKSMLAGEAPRLVRAFSRELDKRTGIVPLEDLLEDALAAFRAEFDLSAAAAKALDEAIAGLGELLPTDAGLLGLSARAPLSLYLWTRRRDHRRRVTTFAAEVRRLCDGLSDLLRLHAGRGDAARAPDKVASALGGGAGLFDPAALAAKVPTKRGSKPLSDARAARIEQSLAALTLFADTAERSDGLHLVIRANQGDVGAGEGIAVVRDEQPVGAAARVFDARVDELLDVFKAVRIARLEIAGDYDDDLHGPILDRFTWHALDADELRLVPSVVVLERAERLETDALVPLSRLLRSGRPVQILAQGPAVAPPPAAERRLPGSYGAGLGYRMMAYREAFVLQTTLAEPRHLAAGIAAMAATLRPAVALVAAPGWGGGWPWLELAAAHQGRATPCFVYRPEAGATFAERFAMAANPDPELAWPVREIGENAAAAPFTFADAAALAPGWKAHVCPVPEDGWNDELVPIAEHLEGADDAGLTIPYVEVVDEAGTPGRAIVSRELAFACRDHRQAWRILQELSGVDSAHARAAAQAAREQALAEARAELEALKQAHALELADAAAKATDAAMNKLVGVLLNLDDIAPARAPSAVPAVAGPAVAAAAAASPAARAPAAPAAEAPAVEEDDDDDDDVSFGEPYIDTILCTSCNECTQINPNLFKYDDNKQAYIADVAAGTFEQLVKGAEKCPAKCIHPGQPRDDDATVNDDLLARAAGFN